MSDLCISICTLTGYARAKTHFKEASLEQGSISSWGHRLVAFVEMVPALGLLVAIIDCIVSGIFHVLFSQSGDAGGKETAKPSDLAGVFKATWKDVEMGIYTHKGKVIELKDTKDIPGSVTKEHVFPGKGDITREIKPLVAPVSVTKTNVIDFTLEIAKKHDPDTIAILNLANENSPGGGVKGGAKAQEEDICRCSTLYRYLKAARNGVEKGRFIPEHGCLVSPATIFKDANYDTIEKPVTITVLTAAGYCLGTRVKKADADFKSSYVQGTLKKIYTAINAAKEHSKRVLVLGALGCGAFNNDPELVSELFCIVLGMEEFQGCFDQIYFSIMVRKGHSRDLPAFNAYSAAFSD